MIKTIVRYIAIGINGLVALAYIPASLIVALWAYVVIRDSRGLENIAGVIMILLGVELVCIALGSLYMVIMNKRGWKLWLGLASGPVHILPLLFIYGVGIYAVGFSL